MLMWISGFFMGVAVTCFIYVGILHFGLLACV